MKRATDDANLSLTDEESLSEDSSGSLRPRLKSLELYQKLFGVLLPKKGSPPL